MEDTPCPSLESAKDRRRAASRANAAKSTGPKTAAGKARSGKNALRHGMRSETGTLPDQLAPMLRTTTDHWIDELRPEGQAEIALVKQAAFSTVCLDWLGDQHVASVSKQVRRAGQLWDDRQARAAGEEAATFDTDPAVAISLLRNSAAGCDWLLDRWNELRAPLERGGVWTEDNRSLLVRLLGHTAENLDDATLAIQLLSCDLATDSAANLRDQNARTALLAFTTEKIEELKTLRQQLWAEMDGGMRREAENVGLLPQGKSAGLSLRYQGMHIGGLHRSLNLLIKIRTLDASPRTNDFRGRPNLDAALEPVNGTIHDCTRYGEIPCAEPERTIDNRQRQSVEAVAPNEARTPVLTTTCVQTPINPPASRSAIRNGDRDELQSIPTRQVQPPNRWVEQVKRLGGIVGLIVLAIFSVAFKARAGDPQSGRIERSVAAPNEARTIDTIKTCDAGGPLFSRRFEAGRTAKEAG